MKPTPILFLDLDGTVRLGPVERKGKFVNEPADVDIFDGVVDIMKSYKARGWRIVSVSNQGGIALGHVSANAVNRTMMETSRMCANLFDKMLWCEHHPAAKGETEAETLEKSSCLCRKPRIGMVVMAIAALSAEYRNEYYRPYSSLFVGDMVDDELCAASAGIPFMSADAWRRKGPLR